MKNQIETSIKESIRLKKILLNDKHGLDFIESISNRIIHCLQSGGKILICGNGGSAADSQHFAAELVGRFAFDRKALPAVALTTDTSIITAVSNDYSFDEIFSRQIEALCKNGDVVVGISTSGNSPNVIKALQKAKELGAITCALLGHQGGTIKDIASYAYVVPSNESARIQEVHIMMEHIICQMVEKIYFNK